MIAMKSQADIVPPPTEHQVWPILVVLTAALSFSFLDRQILTLLVEPIRADLGLSDVQVAQAGGLAFALTYTFCGPALGWLADRYDPRRLLTACMVLWCASTIACAFAQSGLHLAIARSLVGLGEAALAPCAYLIISRSTQAPALGRAFAFYGLGAVIGTGMGLFGGGMLLKALEASQPWGLVPWRWVFIAAGAPGLLVALSTLALPSRRQLAPALGAAEPASVWRFFASRPWVWIYYLLAFSAFAVLHYGVFFWSPTWLSRTHAMTVASAGQLIGVLTIVAGPIGLAFGGLAIDRLRASTAGAAAAPALVAMGCSLPLAIACVLAFTSDTFAIAAAGLCAIIFFSFALASISGVFITSLAPEAVRGRATAGAVLVTNLAGLGFGPTLFALLTTHHPGGLSASLLIISLACASLSLVSLWLLIGRLNLDAKTRLAQR